MVTVYRNNDKKIKSIVSLVLFLILLFIIGPLVIFDGIEYIISIGTNKFYNIWDNLPPLLTFIALGMLIINYFKIIFINNDNKKLHTVFLSLFGIVLLSSFVLYLFHLPLIFSSFKNYFVGEYYDSMYLKGVILLIIGIILFGFELSIHLKNKDSLAKIFVYQNVDKFKKVYGIIFIFLVILFLYNLKSFVTILFKNQGDTIGQIAYLLFLGINIFDFIYMLIYFNKKFSNFNFLVFIVVNVIILMNILIIELENPSFLVHIMKPVSPLTYAISFPVYFYLLIINVVGMIVLMIIRKLKIDR